MFPHFRPSLRWIALGLLVVWLILIINLPLGMLAGGTSNAPASNPYQLNRAGPASESEGDTSEPGRVNAFKGAGLPVGPILGGPVVAASFDGDLRDLPHEPSTEERLRPEFESPFEEAHEASFPSNAADPVVQNWDGSVKMPSPSQSFKGISRSSGGSGWPPDTNGDVGPNHYIQTVNTSLAIYSKTGTQLLAPTSLNSFFQGAGVSGTPCDSSNDGDPIVVYDLVSGRWIVTDFAWTDDDNGPYYECIAVSKTADPVSGGWWMYALDAGARPGDDYLADYPKLGVWSDGIYMSANMFDCVNACGSGTSFTGVRVWAFNRTELINGSPLNPVVFDLPSPPNNYFSLLPSNLLGALPPAGRPNYFGSIDALPTGNTFYIWKFQVNWTTPVSSTFTGPTAVTVASFNSPFDVVPQQSPGEDLDDLSGRLMMQLQYRNFNGTEALWVNHTVSSSGVTGVRWYEIRNPNGTPTVHQQSTYQPDGNYRWMGSLAVDQSGNMALGYSLSSSSKFPEIRYVGRLVNDPLNTLPQGEATLIAGTGAQTNGFNRWGDYSSMSVDPVDGCTFWYTTEYYESTGSNWQTRIGAFKFPSCGSVVTPTVSIYLPALLKQEQVTVCNNLLLDPSFESYTPNPYWDEASTQFGTPLCQVADCGTGTGTAGPRTGSTWAWFGGLNTNNGPLEVGSLTQNVIIPSGTASIQFYLWLGLASAGSDASDMFNVQVDGNTVFSVNATQAGQYPSYTLVKVNLDAYANGASHQISLNSTTTDQIVNFSVDDVQVCSPAVN